MEAIIGKTVVTLEGEVVVQHVNEKTPLTVPCREPDAPSENECLAVLRHRVRREISESSPLTFCRARDLYV